jgi:hypothetical protein
MAIRPTAITAYFVLKETRRGRRAALARSQIEN